MLVDNTTTLRVEDFPTQKEWIGKLIFPLNQFLTAATQAINGNISYSDNIPCQTQTMSFTYGSTGDFPKNFKYNLLSKPVELRVCSATEDSVAIAVVPEWSYSNGLVYISNFYKITSDGVVPLTTNALYNIVLRVQP